MSQMSILKWSKGDHILFELEMSSSNWPCLGCIEMDSRQTSPQGLETPMFLHP